jgi:N-acetylglucosaminyldiphosphoundecaprenol N-acetyl-beta-D-mannosaminyltransferase
VSVAKSAVAGQADYRSLMAQVRHVQVGGLPVAVLDRMATARLTADVAVSRRHAGGPCPLFTTANGQVISMCASDPAVRRAYSEADLISADGMSVVIASRLRCPESLPERVATTDAFHDVAEIAEREAISFYFLGASEEVNAKAVAKAMQLYPGLRSVGRRNGYFSSDEEEEIIEAINAAAPDILWIGMGVPRQQHFVLRHRARLTRVGLVKTCGGLFDFLAGKSSRAPYWMQRYGLEWLYRTWREPRRLGWRYAVTNPHAIWLMAIRSGR